MLLYFMFIYEQAEHLLHVSLSLTLVHSLSHKIPTNDSMIHFLQVLKQ